MITATSFAQRGPSCVELRFALRRHRYQYCRLRCVAVFVDRFPAGPRHAGIDRGTVGKSALRGRGAAMILQWSKQRIDIEQIARLQGDRIRAGGAANQVVALGRYGAEQSGPMGAEF